MNELALFAGAGGGILGGMLRGWRTVAAVEIEDYPRRVLLQRQADGLLPRFPIWDDVRTFDGTEWRGKVDIITGGFPCQDISCAGKGAGIEGERSGMWGHMARIVGEVRPEYVFVENSPMLVGRGLARVIGDLAEMGYDAKWGIVGAHHVAAPHKRDRIWIMANTKKLQRNGSKDNSRELPQSKPISQSRNNGRKVDVADTFSKRLERFSRDGKKFNKSGRDKTKPVRSTASKDLSSRPNWWSSEPELGRVANGVACRVDRLKAIGNGQVPAVAALAWDILSKGNYTSE